MDVQGVLARASESLTAARSFGPVVERDGCVVIPTAIVLGGGGGGGDEGPRGGDGERGTAGGVGHFSVSWPIGAYVVRGDTVRWVPAVDVTRLAIAALALVRLRRRHARRSST